MIPCKSGKERMTDPSSTSAPPFTIPTTVQLLGFNLNRVTNFFLEHLRRGLTQDRCLFRGIARHPSGDKFKIIPGKTSPFASGQNHQIRIFNAGYLHQNIAGRGDARKAGDHDRGRTRRTASA